MKPLRTSILAVAYICLVLPPASCVREDMSACMVYELNVQAVDAEGNDLSTSGVLEKSEVYLFGKNGFVRMVPAGVSSDYLFGNYKEEKLTLVAWGNVKEDTLITAGLEPGTPIEEARLRLKQHAEGNHLPITDIFYCCKELNNVATRSVQEESITLVMERMAAGLSIRTRHLADQYPYEGTPYTFIVKGTGSEMDFRGKVTGESAGYKPATVTDGEGDAYTPSFRIFPTEEGEHIEVEIYRGEEKLCTVAQDGERNPLRAEAGKQTDIEIDFRYTVTTLVKVLPWGETEQETEM
ncbi:FimB/Mfa2 family fimbrial subunit [Bacteroides gallinarum]|uniref:FimB/Mfa2 family fimbrial subunit n=1 Tax=Bacteroides gallinarum TaxID=376806 RepID=UPI000379EAD5|nr:FimB/Mfa2 family fimbrial subunit [Bacteroides gallinarum]